MALIPDRASRSPWVGAHGRVRRAVAVALVVGTAVTVAPAVVAADPGDDVPGEGSDRAVPAADTAQQLARAGSAPAAGGIAAARRIEDYSLDRIISEGRAADICFGRLRRGTGWAYHEVTRRFGGSPGTLYACRERWAVHEDPACNGTVVNPVTNPDFRTHCWSNHAQGRAFDVMVGRAGRGYNTWRGNAIVDWLLASDAAGNQNAMARRLGVQQILWNDRCWNTDGDRGIAKATDMRVCGYGHFDHIHVDLTLRGSRGRVSYWGVTPPPPSPKLSGMFERSTRRGDWTARAWRNLRPGRISSATWTTVWERTIAGDWDGDGAQDEMFMWSTDDGRWMVRAWNGRRWRIAARGQWSNHFDDAAAADLDRDRKLDELLVWDRQTGAWEVHSWSGFAPTHRRSGQWSTPVDQVIAGDWDSDGVIDETFAWDRASGKWSVASWASFAPTARGRGRWSTVWDQVIAGDWDAQGNFDEMFRWDRESGAWDVLTWSNVRSRRKAAGTWPARWDRFFAGDFDTDGRIDDLYVRDDNTGAWKITSWHRFEPEDARTGASRKRWRQFTIGVWGR